MPLSHFLFGPELCPFLLPSVSSEWLILALEPCAASAAVRAVAAAAADLCQARKPRHPSQALAASP